VELTVAEPQSIPTEPALAAVSRAFVSAAADIVTGVQKAVVGTANVRTARDNAWDAMLADRAANQARADLTREVAALLAAGRHPAAQKSMAKTR
jgi:hypothetical protein